jgi:hypothetical protein
MLASIRRSSHQQNTIDAVGGILIGTSMRTQSSRVEEFGDSNSTGSTRFGKNGTATTLFEYPRTFQNYTKYIAAVSV